MYSSLKPGLRLTVVTTLLLLAAACGSDTSSPTSPQPATPQPATAPPATPAPSPTPSAASVTIPMGASSLGDKAYVPASLDVAVGSTVTWINTDSISHTSTSNGSGWDSGIVAPGAQFSFAFQTAGTFQYHCAIHPGMTGTVVVR